MAMSNATDRYDALDKIVRDRDETPITLPRWVVAEVFARACVEDYAPNWRGEDEAMDVVGDALGVPLPTGGGER